MTTLVPIESIVSKIVFLRGEKVMLDRDVAELYGIETNNSWHHLKQRKRKSVCRQRMPRCLW